MKQLFIIAALLLIIQSAQGQTSVYLSPDADAYIEAFGGGQGKNTFMKFPLASIPPNAMAISTVLRVYVKEIGLNWDRDVMYIHYLNQIWTETDSTQYIWNDLFWGDTIVQSFPLFGDTIGHTTSIDLSDLLNMDINGGNSYFSVRIKDPDDPTMFPMINIPITNSFDSLMIGNIFDDYIIFQPRDMGLAQNRPVISLTYIILPMVDAISGYGEFCVNDNMTLLSEISGDGPFSFQWQKDNIDIGGETDSILTLNSIQISDAGWYRLIVTSPWASDTSVAVQCIVNSCVGVPDVDDPIEYQIFPNPAKEFCILPDLTETVRVQIFSVDGAIIYDNIHENINSRISLSAFHSGIYTIKIISSSKEHVQTLIISK
jgi:hypothetical protein